MGLCRMNRPTLRDEITATLKLMPERGGFSFVSPTKYESVIRRIADRFLRRGILDVDCAWWWECLKKDEDGFAPSDPIGVIENLLNQQEEYWFIASEEHSGPKWLCEAGGSRIVEVLREMHHFEYYIVQKKLAWLLGENHHGFLFAAGDDMPHRLQKARQAL